MASLATNYLTGLRKTHAREGRCISDNTAACHLRHPDCVSVCPVSVCLYMRVHYLSPECPLGFKLGINMGFQCGTHYVYRNKIYCRTAKWAHSGCRVYVCQMLRVAVSHAVKAFWRCPSQLVTVADWQRCLQQSGVGISEWVILNSDCVRLERHGWMAWFFLHLPFFTMTFQLSLPLSNLPTTPFS